MTHTCFPRKPTRNEGALYPKGETPIQRHAVFLLTPHFHQVLVAEPFCLPKRSASFLRVGHCTGPTPNSSVSKYKVTRFLLLTAAFFGAQKEAMIKISGSCFFGGEPRWRSTAPCP